MANSHDRRLEVKVARLYYEDQLTQQQISERLRLSRQKVQRLLSQAQQDGIVQITVQPLQGTFSQEETALEKRFNLQEAIVVETSHYEDQAVIAREVGAAAANYLLRILQPQDRVVISWGGTLLGMTTSLFALSKQSVPDGVEIIQGLGGLGAPSNDSHAAELVRRFAQALQARAWLLPAPGIAGSRETGAAFYQDPHVCEVLEVARRASIALMGIGAPRPDSILVQSGTLVSWAELEQLTQAGAVGDLNLRYFDAEGRAVASDLDARVIGLTLAELQNIKRVIGIVGGASKFRAIQGALAGHLLNVLVTDHITAQRLLDQA